MRTFSRRTLAVAAVTCAVAAAPHVVSGASTASIRFGAAVTAIPETAGASNGGLAMGEPSLLVQPDGSVLVSAQFQYTDCATGTPTTKRPYCVWRSSDGGRT